MNIAAQANDTKVNTAGGYRYIPSVFQYSSGVAAEDGFELVRARFHRPVPLHEGFAAIEAHLRALGRPLQAFAQCELRSPRPYTEEGFLAFNRHYVKTLEAWDLCDGKETPVARTHVCPLYDAPKEPSMHAFTYTMPSGKPMRRSFMLAGGGDLRRGPGSFKERCVRLGDTSAEGLREKMQHVIAEMERRMTLLGFGWADAVSVTPSKTSDIWSEKRWQRAAPFLVGWYGRMRNFPWKALLSRWTYAALCLSAFCSDSMPTRQSA